MSFYFQTRIESIKSFYENRISNMIQEYSFQDAKFQSQISNLSYLYENLQNQHKAIEEELLGKSSSMHIINKERKELLIQKQNLDKFIEKTEVEHKINLTNASAELQYMKMHLEIKENDLKTDYDKKIQIITNRKLRSVEGIKSRYQRKLEKILKESEDDVEK